LIYLNSLGQVLCLPSFMYFYPFFNNIYEHLTHVCLEWSVNFIGTPSILYMSFCSILIQKKIVKKIPLFDRHNNHMWPRNWRDIFICALPIKWLENLSSWILLQFVRFLLFGTSFTKYFNNFDSQRTFKRSGPQLTVHSTTSIFLYAPY